MELLRVGIVGAGQIADYHIRSYLRRPDVQVRAVCDIDAGRARGMAAQYGIEGAYDCVESLCADESIDAVSLTTWTNTHEPIALALLGAGKHVLCEKPPSVNAAGAVRMREAARKNGQLLMYGFVRRFGESEQTLRRYIDEGRLGDIRYVKAGYVRRCGCPGGWFTDRSLSGGGPLIDIGIHCLDLSLYFMGYPRPRWVLGNVYGGAGGKYHIRGVKRYTAGGGRGVHDVEDAVNALIRFDNGASLFLEAAWTLNIKADAFYVDLCGDRGGARLEPELEIFGEEYDHLVDIRPVLQDGSLNLDEAFAGEIGHFVDCVLHGGRCRCGPDEGIAVMNIIDAVYESARAGEPVDLG